MNDKEKSGYRVVGFWAVILGQLGTLLVVAFAIGVAWQEVKAKQESDKIETDLRVAAVAREVVTTRNERLMQVEALAKAIETARAERQMQLDALQRRVSVLEENAARMTEWTKELANVATSMNFLREAFTQQSKDFKTQTDEMRQLQIELKAHVASTAGAR